MVHVQTVVCWSGFLRQRIVGGNVHAHVRFTGHILRDLDISDRMGPMFAAFQNFLC